MLNGLERRFGRFCIPNLTLVLIGGQALLFMMAMADPTIHERVVLIPALVMEGEVWRLLSFIFTPPSMSPLWAFFYFYMFYLMGTALEHYWGTFRFNMFVLIGGVATAAAAFLTPEAPAGSMFLKGTIFLAFAFLNPTFTIHIFFVLPVQIRWLAMITWFFYGVAFIGGDWGTRVAVVASVLNFFLFFGKDILARIKHGGRHMSQQAKKFADRPDPYIHKCQVCGITDADDRHMDFRYCGQCAGDLCYCSDHLKNHEHIQTGDDNDEG